ncbi:YgaP family membrane protein [Hwanghaeella sp.]|uniref:YgaP family membrane protein n=1 Tax=Hwanghaeella sp. TaxID=2605943 RepID=UPI003CCB8EF4
MVQNVGKIDRILRLVLGLVLIVAPFVTELALWQTAALKYGAVVVGVVFVATAFLRFCPLYRLIGMNTCKI